MSLRDEILSANARYAAGFGEKSKLSSPPARHFAILTCMDARMDPAKFAGLSEGDAHVIRNAGGRASDDAIRSLILSHKLLGTTEWFVIHHTDCGMESITNDSMAELLEESLATARYEDGGWKNTQSEGGSPEGHYIDWLPIKDQVQSIVDDVRRLRAHPLVARDIRLHGFLFDVKTGDLIEIPEAREAGRQAA
jgi:carbonic anhydrase